jgi:hypothetical protein
MSWRKESYHRLMNARTTGPLERRVYGALALGLLVLLLVGFVSLFNASISVKRA